MAFAPTSADVDPPEGIAVVKRGRHIRYIVHEQSATTGLWSAKDISGSRWTYRLRLWTSDDDSSALSDAAVTKGSASSSGELDHYHACGTTVRDTLAWEIVEVDNDNADANTTTGKREVVKVRWYEPIRDAP